MLNSEEIHTILLKLIDSDELKTHHKNIPQDLKKSGGENRPKKRSDV
ncbi:hypothetical protein [Shewanella morhuae]|nr:hypothetical protein [Shewanella morhuae]GIU13793.1 hypothetical protein TUM4641_33810 [Shewanella morhuae]